MNDAVSPGAGSFLLTPGFQVKVSTNLPLLPPAGYPTLTTARGSSGPAVSTAGTRGLPAPAACLQCGPGSGHTETKKDTQSRLLPLTGFILSGFQPTQHLVLAEVP